MSKKIIQLNEGAIKEELKELVRGSVEETLNYLQASVCQLCERCAHGRRESPASPG